MASVSFPFTCREKQNKLDVLIFEVLQILVNALQTLKATSSIDNDETFAEVFLLGKAACKGREEFQRTFDADFPCEQGPYQLAFFGYKSQPSLAISSHMKVYRAIVTF